MASSNPLIFLHIPKTGGSTLQGIIQRNYGKKNCYNVPNNREVATFAALPHEQRNSIRALMGHHGFGAHKHFENSEDVKYITMLRDPVDRIISNYYWILERPEHHTYKAIVENNYSVADYVSSGVIANAENAQVRLLSNSVDTPHGGCTREMLEQAKANLVSHFQVVGVNKKYDQFLMLTQKELDWKMPYYFRANVTKKKEKREAISADKIAVIKEYNALDAELFAFAEARFDAQWAAAGLEDELKKFKKWNKRLQKFSWLRDRLV
jgi:hypothetical protein